MEEDDLLMSANDSLKEIESSDVIRVILQFLKVFLLSSMTVLSLHVIF